MFLKSMIPKLCGYLDQEKITYEVYQEERKIQSNKRKLPPIYDEPRKNENLKKCKEGNLNLP